MTALRIVAFAIVAGLIVYGANRDIGGLEEGKPAKRIVAKHLDGHDGDHGHDDGHGHAADDTGHAKDEGHAPDGEASKAPEITTEEAAPADESKPEEPKTEEAKPEEAPAEEAKPEEAPAEEAKPEEPKAEEAKPEEPKAEEAKPEVAKTEEAKPAATEDTKPEATDTAKADADDAKPAEEPAADAKDEGVQVVDMTGNDLMMYNTNEIKTKAGTKIRLNFKNVGKKPKESMAHNMVILKPGNNALSFGLTAGSKGATRANGYIPESGKEQILAHTKLLGPGESDTIEFVVPEAGEYEFVSTYPGEAALMRGKLIAE